MEAEVKFSRIKVLSIGEPTFQDRINELFNNQARKPGHRIRYALFEKSSLEESLECFSSDHPDLVVISDSFQDSTVVCQTIRNSEDARHTGIIVFESLNCGRESVEFLEQGADDFISTKLEPREVLARASSVVRLKKMTDELRHANHRLEILSFTDDLTGLYNMRYLQNVLTEQVVKCRDQHEAFGVVMMDLDKFKSINDKTNHLVGSFIISEVGKLLRLTSVFGERASIARYGGDEYIAIVPCGTSQELVDMGNTLRHIISTAVFHKDGFELRLTASIGICFVQPGFQGDANDPVKCADLMLYKSKGDGRDRVSMEILESNGTFQDIALDQNQTGSDHEAQNKDAARYNYIKVVD